MMTATTSSSAPAPTLASTTAAVDPMLAYLFDLNGYLILKKALDKDHLRQINAKLDEIMSLSPPLQRGEWYGDVHAHSYGGKEGVNLQQIYEAGEPFERLIDHPAWMPLVTHFIGGADTFDWQHGPLFIDENFANIRGPGDAIGVHSGGELGVKRTQFRYHNGRFQCGQINILMAFNDIGPGDGATMVIPGSHKANLPHPQLDLIRKDPNSPRSGDGVVGAVECHLEAGDALLFVDAISHGSARRVNPGQRRIAVYRYGPSWGNFRFPYYPSQELLDRLPPARRQMVLPQRPEKREPNRIAGFSNPPHAR